MAKTITLDWDSLQEVTKLFNQAKARYFELKRQADGTPSRKARQRQIYDACREMLCTDISSLYRGLALDNAPVYYVYAHLDTSLTIAPGFSAISSFAASLGMAHMPFYIGKGVGDRCDDLNRSETHRKIRQKLTKMGRAVKVHKVRDGLTESSALELEAKLIDIFGLIPESGYLANLDEGVSPTARRALYGDAFLAIRSMNKALTLPCAT